MAGASRPRLAFSVLTNLRCIFATTTAGVAVTNLDIGCMPRGSWG